jgi:hypothetical protein
MQIGNQGNFFFTEILEDAHSIVVHLLIVVVVVHTVPSLNVRGSCLVFGMRDRIS